MDAELQAYMKHIEKDYFESWGGTREFSIGYIEGSKYIKVYKNTVGQESVHSFIVKKPVKGFVKGDILKAAGWKAPTLNFKRGNILTGEYAGIRWTGAWQDSGHCI